MRHWLQVLALAAVVLGVTNFLWFWVESATMGDAVQGRVENGHYLLVNKGTVTEVSRATWEWSLFHGRSILLTHPLALLAGFYLGVTTWPQLAGVSVLQAADHARLIRASGPATASTRTGMKIGSMVVTRPLVRVDTHPGGLVLTALGSSPVGIGAWSIVSVDNDRSRLSGRSIRITHQESGVPGDVRLYLADNDPVVTELRGLVPLGAAERQQPTSGESTRDRPEPYSAIFRVGMLFGLGVSVVMVIIGFAVVIPKLGPFGWAWTGMGVLILVTNLYRFVTRDRDRW